MTKSEPIKLKFSAEEVRTIVASLQLTSPNSRLGAKIGIRLLRHDLAYPPEPEEEKTPMLHEMKILDQTGHSVHSWDPQVPAEVEAARAAFDALRAKGYRAFLTDGGGQQSTRMDTFDPQAGEMLFVPQLKGG